VPPIISTTATTRSVLAIAEPMASGDGAGGFPGDHASPEKPGHLGGGEERLGFRGRADSLQLRAMSCERIAQGV
jgi:hypothetical protein